MFLYLDEIIWIFLCTISKTYKDPGTEIVLFKAQKAISKPCQSEHVGFLSAPLPSLKCNGNGSHFVAALRICWKNIGVIQKSPVTVRETCAAVLNWGCFLYFPFLKNQTTSSNTIMQL